MNLISISGGKDSTALALLAVEREVEDPHFVFCDTGNESKVTYDYIEYLNEQIKKLSGQSLEILKPDFSEIINKRRVRFEKNGDKRSQYMKPSGNPFLDLAIVKGRFPSTMARFCTQELKLSPVKNYINSFLAQGEDVENWSGIRSDESSKRAKMPMRELFLKDEKTGAEAWHYRPILDWKAEDCFKIMKRYNIEPNPLYKLGFSRVGCFPCINARKSEIRDIFLQFPEEFERIRQWEKLAGLTSKRGQSTFFPIKEDKRELDDWIKWSLTDRRGREMEFDMNEIQGCRSVYGLCE